MAGRKSGDQRKPTIFDVAELAGVSIKTVSRVINKEPNVQQRTQEKVLKAVEKLDYRPNAAARGLSSKRSYILGLIYENSHEFGYIKDILNGALDVCQQGGYSLLLQPLSLPNENIEDDVRQFVLRTQLDGIILTAPICDNPGILSLLSELNIATVQVSPKESSKPMLGIVCNDEEASFSLTEYVISQGHQEIGFIKGHPDHSASEKRLQGYRRALKKHGLPYSRKLVLQGYFNFESGKNCAQKLLSLTHRPSAIIASNDDMAAGVVFEAYEKGLSIPGELSVVGFDDTPLASHIWPPLTTVRQPISDMARTAAELLIKRLQNPEDVESPLPFNCELVVRSSTGPVGHHT